MMSFSSIFFKQKVLNENIRKLILYNIIKYIFKNFIQNHFIKYKFQKNSRLLIYT